MSEYSEENRGIISKNERKSKETHPDITGSINIEGTKFFLDGWRKTRKDGSGGFYSLRVKRMEKQQGAGRREDAPPALDDNDNIPF